MAESTKNSLDSDPFFRLNYDSKWNARIGQYSHEENYADGYIEAALELVNSAIERDLYWQFDTLVLPILYNARHSIELTLKMVMNRLVSMGVLKAPHPKNHDILSHWKLLRDSIIGDDSLTNSINIISPFVESLSRIDKDGQSLRYHEIEGQPSLANKKLIDLHLVRRSLRELHSKLESCKYHINRLEAERKTGAYTRFCSRNDLLAIVKMLPPIAKWKSCEFDDARDAIKSRFSLSGRAFSAAIDVIKNNREMAAILGKETNLLYISDENALFIARQWHRLHPPEKDEDEFDFIGAADVEIKLFLDEEGRTRNDIYQLILERVDKNELADMEVIFYLARDNCFSEYYEQRVAKAKIQYGFGFDNNLISLSHIIKKRNFLEEFGNGVAMLGRPSLAKQLSDLQPTLDAGET